MLDENLRCKAEEITQDLDNIAERLTEMSVDLLRTALEAGEQSRPAADKKISQAVRAVEKASKSLQQLASADETD